MTRVTQLIHDAGKYLLISVYPLPTHPTHNFTHTNGGNLETLPGWPKKLQHNRPARSFNKQRFLTPGHQGWNDLHSLCRIGMEYYLLNNDDNNIVYWIFYHDVGEIWWPQPIRLLKMGHVTGQGSTTTTWVGRMSDLGKSSFHKMCKKTWIIW